jgi:hypothetical protein
MTSRAFDGVWEITGDRETHAEYGVGPASDYKLNRGTVVRAPEAGTISTYWSNTGGNTIVVDNDHAAFFIQHNESFTRTRGRADERDDIARSGNTGSETTGPHQHIWVILNDGSRWSMEEYIGMVGGRARGMGDVVGPSIGGTGLASDGVSVIKKRVDENMACIIEFVDEKKQGHGVFIFESNRIKHIAPDEATRADGSKYNPQLWTAQVLYGGGRGELVPILQFDRTDFQSAIWAVGMEEYSVEQVLALASPGGGTLRATKGVLVPAGGSGTVVSDAAIAVLADRLADVLAARLAS